MGGGNGVRTSSARPPRGALAPAAPPQEGEVGEEVEVRVQLVPLQALELLLLRHRALVSCSHTLVGMTTLR